MSYSRVALSWLTQLAREQDQLGLVELEALHIRLQRLGGLVAASMVDRDANGARLLLVDAGSTQLFVRETTARTDLGVVAASRASHDRSERTAGRSRCQAGSLLQTGVAPASLTSWLVEPGLDVALPPLVEVTVGDHVVTFWRHYLFYANLII